MPSRSVTVPLLTVALVAALPGAASAATTISLSSSRPTVIGDAFANAIVVRRLSDGYSVADPRARLEIEPGAPCFFTSNASPPHEAKCLRSSELDVSVAGRAGDDELTVTGGARAAFLDGEAGADHLQGGPGPDTLRGGAGADLLLGGGDDDLLPMVPHTITAHIGRRSRLGAGHRMNFRRCLIRADEAPHDRAHHTRSSAPAQAAPRARRPRSCRTSARAQRPGTRDSRPAAHRPRRPAAEATPPARRPDRAGTQQRRHRPRRHVVRVARGPALREEPLDNLGRQPVRPEPLALQPAAGVRHQPQLEDDRRPPVARPAGGAAGVDDGAAHDGAGVGGLAG